MQNREKGEKCHEIYFLTGKKIKNKLQLLPDEHLSKTNERFNALQNATWRASLAEKNIHILFP